MAFIRSTSKKDLTNNGTFTIELVADVNDKVYWDIFSMDGKHIGSGSYSEKTRQFNLPDAESGQYIILLRNYNDYYTLKYIIK